MSDKAEIVPSTARLEFGQERSQLTAGLVSERETVASKEESADVAMQPGSWLVVVDRYLTGR